MEPGSRRHAERSDRSDARLPKTHPAEIVGIAVSIALLSALAILVVILVLGAALDPFGPVPGVD